MSVLTLTPKLIDDILIAESNDSRFESFCIRLFSAADGVEYVGTGASWDLGLDGRPYSFFNIEKFPIICCSLQEKVTPNARKDVRRLLDTTKVSSMRHCSSQPISEHAHDKLIAALLKLASPITEIDVLGANHIRDIILRSKSLAKVFEQLYPGELANERAAMAASADNDQTHVSGMRLALSTQLSEDGEVLKNELLSGLILTSLSDGSTKGKGEQGEAELLTEKSDGALLVTSPRLL